MAHGIVNPYDIVLSTSSTEWHGLADIVEDINETTVDPLLFPIIQGETFVHVDGASIKVPNRQTLVADLRGRSQLPEDSPFFLSKDDNLIPMHSPRDSYTPISNRDIWEGLKKSIEGVGGKIVTAGTLNECAKFFVSVDIGQSESIVNGDTFLSHLNFVTSHDGTLAAQAYDSNVRIVCMNTLQWSLSASGDVGFKVYHTKNAPMGMQRFSELLNAILLGRSTFKNNMEYLNSIAIGYDQAKAIAVSFLNSYSNAGEVSTQMMNMAEEIQDLFKNGKGNNGTTLYSLFNGFTECYTHGAGVGKKSTNSEKQYKANFGSAAERKYEFVNFLMGMNHEEEIQKGEVLINRYEQRKSMIVHMVTA
jgi:hypothetical protein